MDFLSFLNTLPKQQDVSLQGFIDFARADKNFPNSSDPELLARYLYRKLGHRLTTAYQKSLMMYFYVSNNNVQPSDPSLLDKINRIVDLQNNDPLYRNIDQQ
jgi:hypothetical protein